MRKYRINGKKSGLPPGTLIHVGNKQNNNVKITLIDYQDDNLVMQELKTIEDAFTYKDTSSVSWVNIDGLQDINIFKKLGKYFNINALTLEDILNVNQYAKFEDYNDYLYVVLKMIRLNNSNIEYEQISVVLCNNLIFTFQEHLSDIFDPIKKRLKILKEKNFKLRADYLFYSLIDIVIDNYFVVLENIEDKIESLESELLDEEHLSNNQNNVSQEIYKLKNELTYMRKVCWPVREMLTSIIQNNNNLLNNEIDMYFKDIYDHIIQIIDLIETFKDTLSSILDIYLSSLSNKMNEVMKVLTIISSIFTPLTFLCGIYGTNFNIPELKFTYSYPIFWGILIVITIIMIVLFKKKKWI